jgi:dTMP kinase
MFITFEGIDGSGKSTQINLLANSLTELNYRVKVLREPGGNILSENIRNLLLHTDDIVEPRCELLLFTAARAQLVSSVIKPALDKGEIVLCDRYIDSSVAYQGYGRQLPIDDINNINTFATAGLLPDATFILDLAPLEASNRADSRFDLTSTSPDRMEKSGNEFFTRARNGYLHIAQMNPERVHVLNARSSIQDLQESIWKVISSLLQRKQQ